MLEEANKRAIDSIKSIVNDNSIGYTNNLKIALILEVLSTNSNSIKVVLALIDGERKRNKEMIKDLNESLSVTDSILASRGRCEGRLESVFSKNEELYAKYRHEGIVHQLNRYRPKKEE